MGRQLLQYKWNKYVHQTQVHDPASSRSISLEYTYLKSVLLYLNKYIRNHLLNYNLSYLILVFYHCILPAGVITTEYNILDYEELDPIWTTIATVTLSDSLDTTTGTLTIDIRNVNEAPYFHQTKYTFKSREQGGVCNSISIIIDGVRLFRQYLWQNTVCYKLKFAKTFVQYLHHIYNQKIYIWVDFGDLVRICPGKWYIFFL